MLLYVDVIDACHLKCPTCARGVRAFANTSAKMPLDIFRTVIAKGIHDGATRVGLFSWIEPFLCPDLLDYIKIIKEFGLHCELSSTLSLPKIANFETILGLLDEMTISISGSEDEINGINHVGAKLDYVRSHLATIGRVKASGVKSARITLRMLAWDYNLGEEPKLRAMAENAGIGFQMLKAAGHPLRAPQARSNETEILGRLTRYATEPAVDVQGKVCPLIFEHVTINAAGDAYQCCAYGNYDSLKIGSFLALSREEILLRRYTHPICTSCHWKRRPIRPEERDKLQQAFAARLA